MMISIDFVISSQEEKQTINTDSCMVPNDVLEYKILPFLTPTELVNKMEPYLIQMMEDQIDVFMNDLCNIINKTYPYYHTAETL